MATHNSVTLYGIVGKPPVIMRNSSGEYIRAMIPMATVRGYRSTGNYLDDIKYDRPTVMSGDPNIIKYMAELNQGDMVFVKGAITTKNVQKTTTCPHCGAKNTIPGTLTFVSPIFVEKREQDKPLEEAVKLVQKKWEISNEVTLVGTVCREPSLYVTSSGLELVTYQLAVNRKFRIKDDAEESRTDFPWVKSYGANADEDAKRIRKLSKVLINGRIQTRKRTRKQVCADCGQEYTWTDIVLEIVPYATEYLSGFRTNEEIAADEAEKLAKIKEEVFGEDFVVQAETPPDTTGIETYNN